MSLIRKINTHFVKGTWLEKKLFVKAFFYSMVVRYWMLKVQFNKYEKYLGERSKESTDLYPTDKHDIIKTVRKVVQATCFNTPWESKCMVQAITCKWLLKKYQIDSTIYFGVLNDKEEGMKAHAWLRVGDFIATGRQGHKKYNVVNRYS